MWHMGSRNGNDGNVTVYARREFEVNDVLFSVTFSSRHPFIHIDFYEDDSFSRVRVEALAKLVKSSQNYIGKSNSKQCGRVKGSRFVQDSLRVMGIPVHHLGYKQFYDEYGFTMASYSKLLQYNMWGMALDDDVIRKVLSHSYMNHTGNNANDLRMVIAYYDDFSQAYKDGIDNIVPIMIPYADIYKDESKRVDISPKAMKKVLGRKVWKKLCANSTYRNRLMGRVVISVYASTFPVTTPRETYLDYPTWVLAEGLSLAVDPYTGGPDCNHEPDGKSLVKFINRIYSNEIRDRDWVNDTDRLEKLGIKEKADKNVSRKVLRYQLYRSISISAIDSMRMVDTCRDAIEKGIIGDIYINRNIRRLISYRTIHKANTLEELKEYHDKLTDLTNRFRILSASDVTFEFDMVRTDQSCDNITIDDIDEFLKSNVVIDNGAFSILKSERDYVTEGIEMSHCLASYSDYARRGERLTFSVTGGDGQRSTLMFNVKKNTSNGSVKDIEVNQHYGKRNKSVNSEHRGIAKKIHEALRMFLIDKSSDKNVRSDKRVTNNPVYHNEVPAYAI